MSSTSVMGGIVRRKEDPSLIQGKGLYVDDIKRANEVAAVFVRSPFAAAAINSIDTSAALALDGVHAVYTADDVRHLGPNLAQVPVGTLRPLLADGAVHHSGEAVAMVIADNRYVAQDGADLVFVEKIERLSSIRLDPPLEAIPTIGPNDTYERRDVEVVLHHDREEVVT